MSKEKQIEEMARIICRDYNGGICATDGFVCNYNCEWTQIAKHLYNAGYRKQSEGEWIVDAWDNQKEEWVTIPYNKHLHADAYCSLCKNPALLDGAEYGVASNYCPNCGARMSGGKNE